jgi:hypothetical protein
MTVEPTTVEPTTVEPMTVEPMTVEQPVGRRARRGILPR